MVKYILTFVLILNGFQNSFLFAQNQMQEEEKHCIFGEIGMGLGQTLFFNNMETKLQNAYGGAFNPNLGNNLMMGFYYAPKKWKGLGLGSRIKGTFGTSVLGDFGDSYIFNYYNLAATFKYFFSHKTFNKGYYLRGSVGFGQFTSKRVNEKINLYKHQYAIGASYMLGLGYTLPFKRTALSIEAEFDYSSRNGTIDNIGDARFQSGQIGGNIIFSF